MGMTASHLDRRIQLQRATLVADDFGMVEVWANLGAPIAAHKRDVSDSERWQAGGVQAQITTRFTVRFSSLTRDLDARDRLVCEHRTYNIVGVKEVPDSRRKFIEITAVAAND